jgi:hypothetical protein
VQHKPEDVQHQTKRLQQNYQTKPSQEIAEQEEHIQAAQEEKRTTPNESHKWPTYDHYDQPTFGVNHPPVRQPILPRSTMSGQPLAQTPSTPTPPSVPGQGEREGYTAGQESPAKQPILPRPAMPRQPQRPELNRAANSSIAQQSRSTAVLSEKSSINTKQTSLDGSLPFSKDKQHDEQNKVIMVVDDSQTVRNIMALILHRSGYRSVRVASAMEALHTLTELTPDLIFLDITLPGMD